MSVTPVEQAKWAPHEAPGLCSTTGKCQGPPRCIDIADNPCHTRNICTIGTGQKGLLHLRFVCGWYRPTLGGAQMLTVWGAGETVVSRWQSEGCHTLAEVAMRSDLSAQQVHGLVKQTCVVCLLLLRQAQRHMFGFLSDVVFSGEQDKAVIGLPVICAMWRQACGLKYYDDFQHRIPAAEVAAVERLVHEARLMHFLRRTLA